MSTFVKEACKFVQAMFEPILVDGLSGKVSAEVLDGYIDIWVPVSQRDQRRLEPNYWAFNTLIQTLAQVLASELPDGVTSDAIAIRLLPPGTRSRSKLQKARQTQHSHQLPAEILGMTVEDLLEELGKLSSRSQAEFTVTDTTVSGTRCIKVTGSMEVGCFNQGNTVTVIWKNKTNSIGRVQNINKTRGKSTSRKENGGICSTQDGILEISFDTETWNKLKTPIEAQIIMK